MVRMIKLRLLGIFVTNGIDWKSEEYLGLGGRRDWSEGS